MSERAATGTRRCAINPIIDREDEGMEITPAPVKKRVLVVGGGPGGLYAAYTAARRGIDVLLCEKEERVGGILKSEEVLPFKQDAPASVCLYLAMAYQPRDGCARRASSSKARPGSENIPQTAAKEQGTSFYPPIYLYDIK